MRRPRQACLCGEHLLNNCRFIWRAEWKQILSKPIFERWWILKGSLYFCWHLQNKQHVEICQQQYIWMNIWCQRIIKKTFFYPMFCVIRPLLLLSFLSHVIPQPMGPAPSWHPGGSDSPASLWDKGGEKEGWEGRKEERMNQNTIKMTMWPFWELRGRWLEAMSRTQ